MSKGGKVGSRAITLRALGAPQRRRAGRQVGNLDPMEVRILPPGVSMEDTPERVYALAAQALLERRAWVKAELRAAVRHAAAQRRLRRIRAQVAAHGLPVPGQRRRNWQTGLPSAGVADQGAQAGTPGGFGPGRASYWPEIGPTPQCGPDDRVRAATFARSIAGALERGGWGNSERAALQKLYASWSARAAGRDARFRIAGNCRGRLPRATERQIRLMERDLT